MEEKLMNKMKEKKPPLQKDQLAAIQAEYPPDVVISATRACIHCQRTHLTCDNNRPCERCVARGLAATCQDGTRKKAKYLNDVPEEVAMSSESKKFDPRYKHNGGSKIQSNGSNQPHPLKTVQNSTEMDIDQEPSSSGPIVPHGASSNSSSLASKSPNMLSRPSPTLASATSGHASSRAHQDGRKHSSGHGGQHLQTPPASAHGHRRSFPFQSPAVNLEYDVIGDILHGERSGTSPTFSDDSSGSFAGFQNNSSTASNNINNNNNPTNQFMLTNSPHHSLSEILANVDLTAHTPSQDWLTTDVRPRPISLTIADTFDDSLSAGTSSAAEDYDMSAPFSASTNPMNTNRVEGGAAAGGGFTSIGSGASNTGATSSAFQPLSNGSYNGMYMNTSRSGNGGNDMFQKINNLTIPRRPADIYQKVRAPFPYTPGYHRLFRYLKSRFGQEDLIQMARCMSKYRPSFIACTNTLDQDDLVFMEQCFQRTLMEYEKYIACSGTPTIVWRRTGQIAAVGKEFCILTGWSKHQLLHRDGHGNGMFVMEVMEDESVLSYFQMFSDISFGDSRDAMMSECSLRTPTGQVIKTASIWTLKRDVFGIPMMIIGNFLPILP